MTQSLRLMQPLPARPLEPKMKRGPTYPEIEAIIETIDNSWAISPGLARIIGRVIIQGHRTRILEFGAGVSSWILAASLKRLGGGRLTSVEENPKWCESIWQEVTRTTKVSSCLIPAGTSLTLNRRGLYYAYKAAPRSRIAERGPYDLVFVDAPWGGFGRDGALNACVEHLEPGALIVVDDTARIREQRTIRRWMIQHSALELLAHDESTARGVSILRWLPDSSSSRGIPLSLEFWITAIYDIVRSRAAVKHHLKTLPDLDLEARVEGKKQ